MLNTMIFVILLLTSISCSTVKLWTANFGGFESQMELGDENYRNRNLEEAWDWYFKGWEQNKYDKSKSARALLGLLNVSLEQKDFAKLAPILSECRSSSADICHAIIGDSIISGCKLKKNADPYTREMIKNNVDYEKMMILTKDLNYQITKSEDREISKVSVKDILLEKEIDSKCLDEALKAYKNGLFYARNRSSTIEKRKVEEKKETRLAQAKAQEESRKNKIQECEQKNQAGIERFKEYKAGWQKKYGQFSCIKLASSSVNFEGACQSVCDIERISDERTKNAIRKSGLLFMMRLLSEFESCKSVKFNTLLCACDAPVYELTSCGSLSGGWVKMNGGGPSGVWQTQAGSHDSVIKNDEDATNRLNSMGRDAFK